MRPISEIAKRPAVKMSDRQLQLEGERIINYFHKSATGDPFGWDWPTMWVLHPDLCDRFRALRAEWKSRHGGVSV